MTALNKQARQVQRYTNYGVDMMEWDDGTYVKYSDYLARLDELEAAEKQLTSWRSLAKQNIEEHEKAVAALDAARQRICELESKLTLSESWSLAAQKYIAELEARTVTLPEALNSYGGMKIYRPKDVIEAIRAAGIGVKGE